jgi:hypothetical protein
MTHSDNPSFPSDTGFRQHLANIRDPTLPPETRLASMKALRAGAFLGPHFDAYRADFQQALREVATDPDSGIRMRALRYLASKKDAFAQELLIQGLRNPERALISDVAALELLGTDDHAAIAPLARDILRRDSDPEAKVAALRLLSSDPAARDFLTALMKDKSESKEVRRASAAGLHTLDPTTFRQVAQEIVADATDFREIRAASRSGLTLLGESPQVRPTRLGASSRSRRAARPPPTSKR